MKKAKQVRSGQAYRVPAGDMVREACCQCGTVHVVQYDIKAGNVVVRAWLDKPVQPVGQKEK